MFCKRIIQSVYVKPGEHVALNCTCSSKANGQWIGPYKSVINSDESNVIPYTQGKELNPMLSKSKYRVLGGYDTKTCDLHISNFSPGDDGAYSCSYIDSNTIVKHVNNVVSKGMYSFILTIHAQKT